jgi:hypothetical protein
MNRGNRSLFTAAALILLVCAPLSALAAGQGAGRPGITFHDLQSQTEAFISYFHDISLSPEEELVKNEALSPIPAPCCDSYSAATCCCVCNLARSIWGLSNYLVHEEKYSAGEVRGAVIEWLNFTNPKGYSGSACFNGGCGRPFARDGCGGMKDGELVL